MAPGADIARQLFFLCKVACNCAMGLPFDRWLYRASWIKWRCPKRQRTGPRFLSVLGWQFHSCHLQTISTSRPVAKRCFMIPVFRCVVLVLVFHLGNLGQTDLRHDTQDVDFVVFLRTVLSVVKFVHILPMEQRKPRSLCGTSSHSNCFPL